MVTEQQEIRDRIAQSQESAMHKESIACRAQKLREQLARLDTIDQACEPTAQQEAIEE